MNEVYKKLLSLDNTLKTSSETDTFLNLIQDAIAIGSWEVHLKSEQIYWSPMTRTIHEVDPDFKPTFDKAMSFYSKHKDRDLLETLFHKAVETGKKYDIELQLTTAKNNIKWVRAIGYPVYENEICVKVMGIFQDITTRTNIIKETALKEKQIRTTLKHSPNGMALVDLQGSFLSLNNTLCEFLGYTEKELLDIPVASLTHPSDREKCEIKLTEMLSGELSNFNLEKKYIHKTGKTVYGLLSTSLLRDQDNQPLYFIKNIIDIGATRQAEKKVQKLLKTTEDQNLRLLNFAHIVSHNLRSHSGNLKMLLELMQEEIPSATKNEYFPLIEKAVNNLTETIDNLNEVSLINTKEDTALDSYNLLEYTDRALSNIRAQIIESKALVNVSINSDITVLSLPAYLESILLNIIGNAIKYKREDVIPKITIVAAVNKKFIKLDISDNGLGINLNLHKDKIFGLYKTFHKHEDSRGLGLFITKNQIDAIGAKVKVISEVNKGSTFTVYFKYENN